MTWVKICGITNLEDAWTAVEAGADALGFVFYQKSPRYVDPETAREIVGQMPEYIDTVGVFVGQYGERVKQVAQETGLASVQLQLTEASEPPSTFVPLAGLKHYLALRANQYLNSEGNFDSFMMSCKDDLSGFINAVFLDSGRPELPGGTGQTFDWTEARHIAEVIDKCGYPLVVAGGLHAGNVTEAIKILKPWGVDVSSGVEARPGKKDPEKVRAFIKAVRSLENRN